MPVNPGDGEELAREIARLVDEREARLLRELARVVAGQVTDPDLTRQARDLQRLTDLARAQGQRLDATLAREIRRVVHDAYNVGAGLAGIDLDQARIDWDSRNLAPLRVVDELTGPLALQYRRAIDGLPQLLRAGYSEAVAAGARPVLGGVITRRAGSQQVLDRLFADGLRGYRDAAGRRWSLDTYVEMSVRTTTGQAAVQGHLDQLSSAGVDLVIVSDAPRECPMCRPWEGQVLSQSGAVGMVLAPNRAADGAVRVNVAGTVDQARAAGLFHPNCRHATSAYLPGVTRPLHPETNPEGYEAAQRQREMERRVRHWKRRQELALDGAASDRAAGKVREWQAALRDHVDAHDLKRLRYREQVGKPGSPLAH